MIHWELHEQEADYVMKLVTQRPFSEVHLLVQKLMAQANPTATHLDAAKANGAEAPHSEH